MIGVFDAKWLLLTAEVLSHSTCKRTLIIHSKDGLDEISCADSTDTTSSQRFLNLEETLMRADRQGRALKNLLG